MRETTTTDKTLAAAIRDGDSQAFEILFYRYYGELKGYLRRKYSMADDQARDVVQEGFVRLWEKRSTIDPQRSIRAFLYQVIRNLAIDHFRKNGKVDMTTDSELLELPAGSDPETLQHLREAIDGLDPPLRDVVRLKWIEGYKYREIGEKLGISERTVEGRMARALKRLIELLKSEN